MAAIALADAETQLAAWLAASVAVAKGQAYQIGNRPMKRPDLKMIGDTEPRAHKVTAR